MPAVLIAVLFVLAGYVTTAQADIFRCPNGSLVSSGDSVSEVIVKCDPPTAVVKRSEPGETSRGRVLYVEVEEWTYNQGPHTLVHYLEFRNGILTGVRTGSFGR
jgi:hypothetical protein